MQTPGMVLMDDEALPAAESATLGTRLRRLGELPLVPVGLKGLDHRLFSRHLMKREGRNDLTNLVGPSLPP